MSDVKSFIRLAIVMLVIATLAMGQSDRGTITGTVFDPASAVVPGAKVVIGNLETGSVFETETTATGNFTITSLPVGIYRISAEADGFKKTTQDNIRVGVAQVLRIDLNLQLGATSDSISVSGAAPILRTENAEQSINLSGDRINSLPLNFSGGNTGNGQIRSPFSFATLLPGTSGIASSGGDVISYGSRINGLPGDTYKVLMEGQDATSGNDTGWSIYMTQASVESIEEYSLQTSNFSAEYGQVGGGLFNFTTRSGTNRVHGSAYEYMSNEALDAHMPFTGAKKRNRKHDYGFSIGGPVFIPKIYNGKNKTFFFTNYEAYRVNLNSPGRLNTVPTSAMRAGNFAAILTGRNLGTDPNGNAILENVIYDPGTNNVIGGRVYRTPFAGNVIPQSRFDPVAVKIQSYFPLPQNDNLINNWEQNIPGDSKTAIRPTIKIDHSIGTASKLSFYYSKLRNDALQSRSADGLPEPIGTQLYIADWSHTVRLNFDHTMTPRLLFHLGTGYLQYREDSGPKPGALNFDAVKELGFIGGVETPSGFPRIIGLSSGSYGGMLTVGVGSKTEYYDGKFTSVASATYIRGNHTYKIGAQHAVASFTDKGSAGGPVVGFSAAETGEPATQGMGLSGGSIGHPYASFLLGLGDSGSVQSPLDPQWRRSSVGLYIQDTWKVTRKFTLDYGLRYDFQAFGHEIWSRSSQFGPGIPNPSAGSLMGAMEYEGYGPGRCNCSFVQNYPYALGPRLGLAYQISSKTVLRAGWGVVYDRVRDYYYGTRNLLGTGQNALAWSAPSFGEAAVTLKTGLVYDRNVLFVNSLDPGLRPQAGQLNWPGVYNDPNMGRPGRINQWTISLQREITKNLVVEAAYVANRGVWLNLDIANGSGGLESLNVFDNTRLKAFGLDMNNAADRALLVSRIDSPLAASRGFKLPYAGYPGGSTVAQTLRQYPQFSSAISPKGAPLGKNWYDSLQVKLTKRYSHGLELTSAFTWQKELQIGTGGGSVNNIFNRDNAKSLVNNSQPLALVVGFAYTTPRFSQYKPVRAIAGDWILGGIMKYTSGMPIPTPASQNALSSLTFQSTLMNRVPGVPLFLKDLNCHCIDANKEFVLNPAAWSDPAPGQWGGGAINYNDFRYQRRPNEQVYLARDFHIREGMRLNLRAEFVNPFNRMYLPNPSAGNPLQTQTRNLAGVPTAGFGYINTNSASNPRSGQLVARFEF